MNPNRRSIPLWSEIPSDKNDCNANRGEGSVTSSGASTERQPGHSRRLSSGAGSDQSKGQGLSDDDQEWIERGRGLSEDLASTCGTFKSVPYATHGRGRSSEDYGNGRDLYRGLVNSRSIEKHHDSVSPGSPGARTRNDRNASLDEDLDSDNSWEFFKNQNGAKGVNSGAEHSIGTTRYNNNSKVGSHDFRIGNSLGGWPRCGTAIREIKDCETSEGGDKFSIDKCKCCETCVGGSNSCYSSKNTNHGEKIGAGSGKSQDKLDAESGHNRSMTRNLLERANRKSSDGGASSVVSESGDDSESCDNSCDEDGRKRSNDSSSIDSSSDVGESFDGLKNSVGRNFGDEEKHKINGVGTNGEDRGSMTVGYGYPTYEPSTYKQEQNSTDIVEGVHSTNSLSRDGGAILKYNHSRSDPKNNSARDKIEIPKEISRHQIREVKYKWQFQNEHGSWITYGQSNSEGAYPTSSKVTSDDIENYYLTDPEKIPLLIKTDFNSYVLNFQTMTQRNEKTEVQRTIRRVPKHETVDTQPPKQLGSASGLASEKRYIEYDFNTAARLVNRQNHQGNSIPTQETIPVAHEWQFEDGYGNWITFGQPNSDLGLESFSTPSSDDIEAFFYIHPDGPMSIQTQHNDYLLNFKTMTQINEKTRVQRQIRRVPKLNTSIGQVLMGGFRQMVSYVLGIKSSTSHSENGVHRNAASGAQHDLTNLAGSNAERVLPRLALSGFNNTVAGPSHLNRAIHDAERPPGTEAAPIGFENFRSGAHASERIFHGSAYASNHGAGAAHPTSFPVNNLAHFPSSSYPHDMAGVRYVWQFQDEHGAWITYGQPNSMGNVICTTSATSDDIERHYSIHQTSKPVMIQSSHNMYVLDFQTMTQTNERTLVQRPFRRVPIHLSHE